MAKRTPTKTERKAVASDPQLKEANLKRLRRIEGQVRGLQKMVEEERYCADILVQLSSIQEALRAIAGNLLENHLTHCVTHALNDASHCDKSDTLKELVELFRRYAR